MNEDYKVSVFKYGEDWIAEYPDLPGCNGVGDTELEAIESAKISKELWLEVYFEENGA